MVADNHGDSLARTGSIRRLPEQECWELLGTTTVGRVAFVSAAGQQLIPLNFAVSDRIVYFHTAPDSVLSAMAAGMGDVAFGVDYHAQTSRDGWSVTVAGSTSTVDDPVVVDKLAAHPRVLPWAPGERSLLVQLVPRSITGRWVSAH